MAVSHGRVSGNAPLLIPNLTHIFKVGQVQYKYYSNELSSLFEYDNMMLKLKIMI